MRRKRRREKKREGEEVEEEGEEGVCVSVGVWVSLFVCVTTMCECVGG